MSSENEIMTTQCCDSQRYRKRAHAMVRTAIVNGSLRRQPCESCDGEAVAHHDDYSRPLDVRWFCHSHHRLLHVEMMREVSAQSEIVEDFRFGEMGKGPWLSWWRFPDDSVS